jgi:predicted amidohydrolase YtcJ
MRLLRIGLVFGLLVTASACADGNNASTNTTATNTTEPTAIGESTATPVATTTSEPSRAPDGTTMQVTVTTSSDWTTLLITSGHTWRQAGQAVETGRPEWWVAPDELVIEQPLADAEDGMTVTLSLPIEVVDLDTDPVLVIEMNRGHLGTTKVGAEVDGRHHELTDPGGPVDNGIRLEIDTGSEAASGTAPQAAGPDWIFHNGTIITITQGRAEALAVDEDRIIAIGDEAEIVAMAGANTQIVDLDGKALLPGFVDAHSHAFSQPGPSLQELILEGGVTTVTEMTTDPDTLQLLYDLDARNELRVRVSSYLMHTHVCGEVQEEWWRSHLDDTDTRKSLNMLELAGVKIFTDGGACNGVARSFPVTDDLGNGPLYFDDATIRQIITDLDAEGYTAGVHAVGDLAVHQMLDVFSSVTGGTPNRLRHRLEHNALVHPDDVERYDDAGMVATVFGRFPACDFQANLPNGVGTPAEYMHYEWPYSEMVSLNPNTTFAWHVDYPYFFEWDVPSQLMGFTTKAEHLADGTWCYPPEGTAPGLDVEDALEIMTIGSARALKRESDIGSLEVGKYADLVILTVDPVEIDPYDLVDVDVELTMVGGRAEFCGPTFAGLC